MSELLIKPKVAGVVVTRDRLTLLQRNLDFAGKQTRPLDTIYVVDIASSDGTPEFLRSLCPPFAPIFLTDNVGGAGGFYAGMKKAFEDGHDYVWCMDDDGYPSQEALERLLEADTPPASGWLNSLVLDTEDTTRLAFGIWHEPTRQMVWETEAAVERGKVLPGANPFNGSLIHKKVADKIGLPCPQLFIWGDEAEYERRVTQAGFQPCVVTASRYFHPASRTVGIQDTPLPNCWKFYYWVRNVEAAATKEGRVRLAPKAALRLGLGMIQALLRDKETPAGINCQKIAIIFSAIVATLCNDTQRRYR